MKTLVCIAALWAGVVLAQPLETATVEHRAVDLSYPAEAVIEAVRQATVAAQVQGRVVAVLHDAGDRVAKGELLMRIDPREAAQALAGSQAQVAQAQAAATNARASYERTRQLVEQKFVSPAALDQALAAHRGAEATLQAALAARGQAGAAQSFTAITAPIAGVVAARHAELGEMATPGKALISVFDPRELRVIASVPQAERVAVAASRRAVVELAESGRRIAATRIEAMPTVDPRSHSLQLRLYLPPEATGVVPGMFARVHFVVGRVERLLIPASAVLRRGELTAAYVVTHGAVTLRQLRLGQYAQGGYIEILAGISAGEQVALDPVQATLQREGAAAR